MVSDSIKNASIETASAAKDFGRKKRTNRSAKLKQCKLDARREQWLSQVNGKKGKEKSNGGSGEIHVLPMHASGENRSLGNLETSPREKQNDGSVHHYSDLDSPSNSPISSSSSSLLSSKNSGTNFSGSSSSSGGSLSGNISEEDGDDGCLDDWEAVADALAINDKQQRRIADTPTEKEPRVRLDCPHRSPNRTASRVGHWKQDCGVRVPRASTGGQAWRPDDALRPQCLPNLSKQRSCPANPSRQYGPGAISWACNSAVAAPLSCPICFEDLDGTDSSFLPCSCGFRLCLFCHKRILEEDGRCPGCRKKYHRDPIQAEPSLNGGSLTFHLTRSCSMVTRS